MRPAILPLFALSLLGCNDAVDSGVAPLEPVLTGSLDIASGEATGKVNVFHAFGYNQDGRVLLYLSSNPEADCDLITELLRPHDSGFDKSDFIVGGTCDIFLDREDYDPATGISFEDDNLGRVGFWLDCYTGEGAFELDQRGDFTDYYWTGRKWLGYPTVYSYSLTGGDGEPLVLTMDLSEYQGNFTDEGIPTNYPAAGQVSGTVEAEWCPGLGTAAIF